MLIFVKADSSLGESILNFGFSGYLNEFQALLSAQLQAAAVRL
jgi:hypothetical protein